MEAWTVAAWADAEEAEAEGEDESEDEDEDGDGDEHEDDAVLGEHNARTEADEEAEPLCEQRWDYRRKD